MIRVLGNIRKSWDVFRVLVLVCEILVSGKDFCMGFGKIGIRKSFGIDFGNFIQKVLVSVLDFIFSAKRSWFRAKWSHHSADRSNAMLICEAVEVILRVQ